MTANAVIKTAAEVVISIFSDLPSVRTSLDEFYLVTDALLPKKSGSKWISIYFFKVKDTYNIQ